MKVTRRPRCHLYLLVISLVFMVHLPLSSGAQSSQVITVPPATNDHHRYCLGLLKLALSYGSTKFEFRELSTGTGGLERELARLNDGTLDVFWTATSNYMETEARAIRVPLYKGLLGYRILLIRKGDQERFQDVKTVDDLRTFTFGQGESWPDTVILKAHNFKVVPVQLYGSLFYMLNGGRYDAFPRGVHEPWGELRDLRGWLDPNIDLEVEKNLAIAYKMPMYLFVGKKNELLAKAIETGLHQAIDEGEFDRYFFNNAIIKEALEKANMHERKVFYIDNPHLPPGTPLENSKLWWSPLQKPSL